MREASTETATPMQILTAGDPQEAARWTALVENSALPDVYYLPEYASATAEIEQTEPVALIAGPSSSRILAPLLIRRMSAIVNDSSTEWLDAATPYGYGGLLSLSASGLADAAALHLFFEQLHDWCSSRGNHLLRHPPPSPDRAAGVVCSERTWENLRIGSPRLTSSIDCDDWDEESNLPKHMNHGRRERLHRAQQALRVTWTSGDDKDIETSLSIFSSLYHDLLDHRAAEVSTGFRRVTFQSLAKLGKRMGVVIAWHGDEPVGANIALAGTRYAYGHLSGTNQLGRKTGASTLLNVEEARWARQRGCSLLHLGGGMQSGDSLEQYKNSFNGPSHSYTYLAYIVDRNKFDQIRRLPDAPWPYNLPFQHVLSAKNM